MGAPAFLSPTSPLCDYWSGSFELMDILYVWICLAMYTAEPALETGWLFRAIQSCGFLSVHCKGIWFSPACCGRVSPVVWRCFWDVDGCEWWFRGELTDGSSAVQRVGAGPNVESVLQSVECILSGQRVAHLITSIQYVHQDFSVNSAAYRPCLAYRLALRAGPSLTLATEANVGGGGTERWGWVEV